MTESLAPLPEPPRACAPLPPATSLSALVNNEPASTFGEPSASAAATASRPRRSLLRYAALGVACAGMLVSVLALTHSTDKQSQHIHHGSAGLKHTEHGNEVRWRLAQTKVYLDASLDKLGPNGRSAIQGAFDTWAMANPELPNVEFVRSENAKLQTKPDGKNTVLVAPITVAGHEHDLAITLTYSDESSGNIVEADIVINSEYPFRTLTSDDDGFEGEQNQTASSTTSSDEASQPTVRSARASCTAKAQKASCEGNSYDVQNVATHEVGHFFGLGEDMEDSAATMYYCTSRCETHKRVLTASDSGVIAALYSAPESDSSSEGAVGCGGARVAPRGGLTEAGIGLALALAALSRRRAR